MPGMMDTVLNLGLNDEVVAGLAAKSGERFAYDSFRRFIDMFGGVVSGSFTPYAAFANSQHFFRNSKLNNQIERHKNPLMNSIC